MSVSSIASYAFGQCTQYMAQVAGWVPAGWGDAKDWLANATRAGYPTTSTPTPGAIAVWGANQGGALGAGHVAQVIGFGAGGLPVVREMNWNGGVGISDTRTLTATQAAQVAGYILPQGASVPSGSAAQSAYASLMNTPTTGATGGNWWDNIPILGGIINTGASVGNFLGYMLDKISDPATYFTLAWLGVAAFGIVSGIHMLTGAGKSAGAIVAAVRP